MLAQSELPGLSIRSTDGDWIDAPVLEDAFLVNSGDLFASLDQPPVPLHPALRGQTEIRVATGILFRSFLTPISIIR